MDEYLRRAARNWPARVALIDAETGDSWTYAELRDWVEQVARGLRERGVDPGDRISLETGRRPETVATLWGVFRAGAVLVPLDPDEPAAERRSRCDRAGVGLRIGHWEGSETGTERSGTSTAAAEIPTVDIDALDSETPPDTPTGRHTQPATRGLDRTRVVLFTSGTTGEPTGVRLMGRNLGASAASTVERLGATAEDRWLLDLPVYHAGGLSIPIRTAMLGATTVLSRDFDATDTARTMADFDITGVSLVPTMLDRLLAVGVPASLRFALVGGAATPPDLVRRALDAGVPIFASYGTTETASGIATATPAELADAPETVGRPVRAAHVSIRGADDEPLDPGETGEIAVSGPIVSPGTIDGTDRDPGSPLRTGDLGYLTPEGRLVVTGRIDDLIVTGGENVSPREVESAIRTLAGVRAVAVLGLPDPDWGERVAAGIVADPDVAVEWTVSAVRARLSDRLPAHKLPKTVAVLESLPRTASGTVDREALGMLIEDSAEEEMAGGAVGEDGTADDRQH